MLRIVGQIQSKTAVKNWEEISMEKFVQTPKGKVRLHRVVQDVELKVAVKRFIVANLIPQIADAPTNEVAAKNVSQLVHVIVNEGIDELLRSLHIIQAMNDKQNNTTH
jgi:hypothetical protein